MIEMNGRVIAIALIYGLPLLGLIYLSTLV